MSWSVAVVGASGYAGGELLRLLAGHPSFTISTVTGSSSAGARLGDVQPHIPSLADLVIDETSIDSLRGHDIVFLALPHGHSAPVAAQLAAAGDHARIIDVAADHRLTDSSQWERYYGGPMAQPWCYGMPELIHRGESSISHQRALLSRASEIAVPGCNATAVTLAIQPAVASGLIDDSAIIATLTVGYSGAGRNAKRHLLASEAAGALVPYGVGGTHRHIPEVLQNLRVAGAESPRLTLTPVLAPVSRGILATVVAPVFQGVTRGDIAEAFDIYQPEKLVDVVPEGKWPNTSWVSCTGRALVAATLDERAGTLVSICALDNLDKGTASAALQCANLAVGLDETTGIPTIGVAP